MGDPVGQDGSVEGRFREAMAGLLKRLQAYEADPALEELYRKYGTSLNGTSSPRRLQPRRDSGELDLSQPPPVLPRPSDSRPPVRDSGESRPPSGEQRPPVRDSGESRPPSGEQRPPVRDSGEGRPPSGEQRPPVRDSGETPPADIPLPVFDSAEVAESYETAKIPVETVIEEIVLEEGEVILEEEWVEEEVYESEEPLPSEEGPALVLPDLSNLPPVPDNREIERVPSRNASVEMPGGYAGQATMFSTAPAMSPAQPAGAAFAPPQKSATTAKIPVAQLMTPAPPPPAPEPRPLTPEEEDARAKRRVARIKCDYVAPAVSEQGESFEVRITDLAIEGAGISAAVALQRGQVLTLSQPSTVPGQLGKPVKGRLMWVQSSGSRSEAGMMFTESHEDMATSWVVELLDQLTVEENQNLMEDRTLADKKETLTVRAESQDGVKAVGRLLNLGLGSAKVSLDGEFKKNTRVDLILGPYQELEALLLPGQVLSVREDDEDDRWVHDIRFLDKSSHQTGVLGRYVLALLQEADL